jgi:phenazine biosynthesis protein phzE
MSLLEKILAPTPPPFALIKRGNTVEVLLGEVSEVDVLANLPLREAGVGHDVLAVVPYRQITERGYTAPDDGTPLVALSITAQAQLHTHEALASIPEVPIKLSNSTFDITDDDYADMVQRVIRNEIGQGKGANFVIKRSFTADITNYTVASALTLFRRLMAAESGAHWTFIVHTGDRTLVGASPERHITVSNGVAVMNPVSGTYRYPTTGPSLGELIDFLSDPKETEELFMVVDEELKMMSRVCEDARVVGPYLKEMSRLAHTEYFIEGHTKSDVREILKETLFAPTVTGSPLESASQVIAEYEPKGRGYYSGIAALISWDEQGTRTLDSTILIRTADISAEGHVELGVGATLVRHSNPKAEVAETKAKAAGVLAALTKPASFSAHPEIQEALASRNEALATFWRSPTQHPDPALQGHKALVVDAEDTFTAMLAHQLRSLGLTVTITRHDEPYTVEGYDLVVMGPGPGDPRDVTNPKIAHLRTTIRELLMSGRPFLAVCLSHQILSSLLGLELIQRDVPNQGIQKEINLFGKEVRVGFYNTFASHCETPTAQCVGVPAIEVARDEQTSQVHALRSANFRSVQFHPESILSPDGLNILKDMVKALLVTEIAASA